MTPESPKVCDNTLDIDFGNLKMILADLNHHDELPVSLMIEGTFGQVQRRLNGIAVAKDKNGDALEIILFCESPADLEKLAEVCK